MNTPTYASGILFSRAHKIVRSRIYTILEKYNLNPTYWAILSATVQASEGARLSSVAATVGVKAPLVTVMADDLIAKGLILRIPHHTDGRAKLLVITPKGKKTAAVIEKRLTKEIAQLLNGLSISEIASFQKALQTILLNAGE